MVVVVVGWVVGGEPGVLIVVGSKVRTLPGGCVEASGAPTAGLKTFPRPEEHQKQMGEDQLLTASEVCLKDQSWVNVRGQAVLVVQSPWPRNWAKHLQSSPVFQGSVSVCSTSCGLW